MSRIEETINTKFREKTILIVGDMVADQFLRGSISRVSREAPVFILQHETTETIGGGAANAATNVAALGGNSLLVGIIGNDQNGRDLSTSLEKEGVDLSGVIRSDSFKTTTKLRVLAGQQYARRQQVIRIDYENHEEIDSSESLEIENRSLELLKKADAVVVSDYGYGVVTDGLFKKLVDAAAAKHIPIFVDSRNRLSEFAGATAATPNQQEVEQLLNGIYSPEGSLRLRKRLDLEALLVTLGNKGMFLAVEGSDPLAFPVVGTDEPVDVTGAGDTVIATFALAVASGSDYALAARIANHAGGIVVMKKGTASLTAAELTASIAKYEPALNESSLHQAK